MGEARRRQGKPYWTGNQQIIKPLKPGLILPGQTCPVPAQVVTTKDIKITEKSISFVGPANDCCVEKVVKEYVPLFEKEGYSIIFTLQKGMQDIIRFAPQWVVLFRAGTNSNFNQEIGMANTLRIMAHLQRLGVRIVYYIDDFLVAANGNAPIQIAAHCDAVIVATAELKDFFKSLTNFSTPVIHVPTHVNLPIFDYVPKVDYIHMLPRFKVLITSGGRVGAKLTHDMMELANVRADEFDDVEWILNANGVAQFRTLVNAFRNLHKTYVDWIPLEMYYSLCKTANVILHPASQEDIAYLVPPAWQETWLNSKSAVKYTMAGAASIPIISSPSRSYKEAIKDGETGFIVNSAEEFLEKLLYLKDNPDETRKIGLNARRDIEENYDISKRYPLYRDAIIGAYKEQDSTIGILTGLSDGGPGAFGNTLRKYVTKHTEGKYKVVDQDSPNVKHIVSVAFLNHEITKAAKLRDPSIKMLQRMDGLPFVSYLGDKDGAAIGAIQPSILNIMKELYALADKIVWQSEWSRQQWKPYVDINKNHVIIYNGVDTEVFNMTSPVIPMPGSTTKILHSSWSVFPHKRADLAIDAAKMYKEIEFYFIGNYFTLDTASTMQDFLVYPNIVYYGPLKQQKQLVNLYRSVDALLFTSEHEGSPNTVLEAAACGCPIIYNKKCGVVPEMFGEEFVMGFESIEDLEEIFIKKLNDIEYIQYIREGMLKQISEKYIAENMAQKYMEVIKNAK